MRTICGSAVIVNIHPLRSVTRNPMWRQSIYRVQDSSVPTVKLFVLPERPCQPILEGDTNNQIKSSFNKGLFSDLDDFIRSKMQKTHEGMWQCLFCARASKVKTNIFEHIEASHVETPGYHCDVCAKPCRTRNALRAHKNREHNFQS